MQGALCFHLNKTPPYQHKINHNVSHHHSGSPRLPVKRISCSRTPILPSSEPAQRQGWKAPPATVVAGATTVVLACTFGAMYLKNGALAAGQRSQSSVPSSSTITITTIETPKSITASKSQGTWRRTISTAKDTSTGRKPESSSLAIFSKEGGQLRESAPTEKKPGSSSPSSSTKEGGQWRDIPIFQMNSDCAPFLYTEPRNVTKTAMEILYEILLGRQSSSTELSRLQLYEEAFYELCSMFPDDSEQGSTSVGGEQERPLARLHKHIMLDPVENYDLGLLLIQIYIDLRDFQNAKKICESILNVEDKEHLKNDPRPHLYMAIIDMMLGLDKMLTPETMETEMIKKAINDGLKSWEEFRKIYKDFGSQPSTA